MNTMKTSIIPGIKKDSPITGCKYYQRHFKVLPVILVTIFIFSQSISGQPENELLSKQIHLATSRGTVQDFLNEMAEDHQIHFSYDPGIIPLDKQVSLMSQNQSLDQILTQLFMDIEIKYTVFDDLIILSRLKKYTLNGFIEDKETGERLIGATIVEINSGAGTVSNNYGFYSLTITEGELLLNVSFVGYRSENLNFILKNDTSLFFRLDPGVEIEEVFVISENLRKDLKSSEISVEKISMKSLNSLPTLLGEGDVMKMMQFLPGIQFGSEASSGIVVRGGSPEQNLILLDGAPVYNSNHAFGLFSVFNSDAIKNLSLIKGGFPARYGGRLSSVIDIRMYEGNVKEFHGNVNLGTIASKFTFEGPIIKDRSSFIVSARRTYVDLLLPKQYKEEEDIPGFYFYDVNAKINYQISKKDKLFLSFYLGHDRFTEEERFTNEDGTYTDNENALAEWGNKTFLTRWNHLHNNKLFSNLSLLYSEYGLKIDVNEEEFMNYDYKSSAVIYNSGINDLSLKFNFDYYPVTTHDIKFGVDYIYHTFNPGVLRKVSKEYYFVDGIRRYPQTGNIDEVSRNDLIYANEFRIFAEDDFTVFEKYYLNVGVHYSGFFVNGVYYSSLEPRISASYSIKNNLAVKGAYSRMKQYLHLLTHSSMGLPTDLWLPVTSMVKPQYSNQYTLGLVYHISEMFKLNIESYYKSLHQIYAYKEGVDYLAADNSWESNIEMGFGKSYGFEFMLRKYIGKLEGWISYTYSKTDREFEEVNNGKPFPYKYDRTHQVNTVVKYAFNPQLSVNATWIYATGMAYTLSTEKYSSLFTLYNWNVPGYSTGYIDAIEKRNNERMPDYHRLDVSLSHYKKRKKIATTLNFSIYNLYNRFNPYLIYWDNDMSDQGKRKLKQVALFSIIPSVSYRIEF